MNKYHLISLFVLFQVINAFTQDTFQKMFYVDNKGFTFIYITNLNDTIVSMGSFSDGTSKGNLISATSPKGDIIWSYSYVAIDTLQLFVEDMLTTKDGNIVVLAELYDDGGRADLNSLNVLSKFSSDGTILWEKQITFQAYGQRRLQEVVETPNRELIIGGDEYLVRLDENGNKLWEKELELGIDYEYRQVFAMPDNSVIVVGTKRNTDFFSSAINFNTVLCKVSQEGIINWSKVIDRTKPSHINMLSDGSLLLFGHSLQSFKQVQIVGLQSDGEVKFKKSIPIKNAYFHPHFSAVLPDNTVALYLTTPNEEYILVKLNKNLEFQWARIYPHIGYEVINGFHYSDFFITLSDDSFVMLYAKDIISSTTSELLFLLRKTDSFGKLQDCYYSSLCFEVSDLDIPASIDIEITSKAVDSRVTTNIFDINGRLESVSMYTQDYCEKPQRPSPYFTTLDTLCVNTPIEVDNLCQDEAATWLWKADGRSFTSEAMPQDFQFETAGLHELTHIIETNGCRDTFSRTLQIVNPPEFNIGQDTVLCEEEPLAWDITQNELYNYTWSDSIIGASRTVSESGIYTAFAENDYCKVRTNRKIDFIRDLFPENPIGLGVDTTICEQLPLVLAAIHPDANRYLWEDNSTNHTRTINKAGFYYVEVDIEGCPFTDEIVIETEDCAGKLYLPTAFSPNGDGQNDFFEIGSKYVEIERIQIFNRWGALLYEGTAAWDGEAKGQAAAEGLYVYTIEYSEPLLGTRKQESGELVLVR